MAPTQTIILPGLGGSGPDHWQSLWATALDGSKTISVSDWNAPDLEEWLGAVDDAVSHVEGNFVFVAHSLGCALAAQWVTRPRPELSHLTGILMVAPADVDDPEFTPDCSRGFGPMPMKRLGCKVITVASTNDPYVSFERASAFNAAWQGTLVSVGDAGHINDQSGLGSWPKGKALLAELL